MRRLLDANILIYAMDSCAAKQVAVALCDHSAALPQTVGQAVGLCRLPGDPVFASPATAAGRRQQDSQRYSCEIVASRKETKISNTDKLTYLLFLKMEYERTRPPYNRKSSIPEEYNWASLIELDGLPLEKHYRDTLENLGKEPGILGIIFRKAQNKIQNPARLRRRIVDLIDKEPWSAL
ncbi:MAG: hypothetical protein ACR2NN_17050 [Bryobacteraceae bacterium]